jgi:hypothetical protein
MKKTRIVYSAAIILSLGCITGMAKEQPAEKKKKADTAEKLPAPVARQWICRRVEPFGIRQIPFAPGSCIVSNGVMKLVNKDTMRIHAAYTNLVLTGDFSLKTRFKGSSFIGLLKAGTAKGLLGIPVRGSGTYNLEITRTGGEVTMLLEGVPFPYRNYGVSKTEPVLFGVILNKGKSCEIHGLECKTSINQAGRTRTATSNKKK